MSKKITTSETQTSEYNITDYWIQDEHNQSLADKWLNMLFPELASFKGLLDNLDVSMEDVFDYLYNLKIVKNHGYGSVTTTVFEHKVTKTEGLIRTIRHQETETVAKT